MKRASLALLTLFLIFLPCALSKHRGEWLQELRKGYEAKRAQSIREIGCQWECRACHYTKRGK